MSLFFCAAFQEKKNINDIAKIRFSFYSKKYFKDIMNLSKLTTCEI